MNENTAKTTTPLTGEFFDASEAFRVPEPHDMDCSSRRGDPCDCARAKAS